MVYYYFFLFLKTFPAFNDECHNTLLIPLLSINFYGYILFVALDVHHIRKKTSKQIIVMLTYFFLNFVVVFFTIVISHYSKMYMEIRNCDFNFVSNLFPICN